MNFKKIKINEQEQSMFETQLQSLEKVNTGFNNCISLYIKEGNNHLALVKMIDNEIAKITELKGMNKQQLLNGLTSIKQSLAVVDTSNIKNGIALFANDDNIITMCTQPIAIIQNVFFVDNKFYLQPLLDMLK